MGLPCGTFNETYDQDMAIVRTRLQWGLLAVFLILLFCLPLFAGDYWLGVLNYAAIWIIAALGLQILTGYSGQISIGQAAFMGMGAYTSAILISRFGFNFWQSIPFAIVVTGLIGAIFSLPAVRVKGFYLAMTTLAAQFIFTWVIMHGGDITGGTFGIIMPRPTIAGITINTQSSYFYLIMPFTVIAALLAKNITRTKIGRAFIAIRDNDLAAEIMGINLYYHKILAFLICSCYAGLAGCLMVNYLKMATYEHYGIWDSIWMLGMLIVGGLGSIMGVIFGVLIIRLLWEGIAIGAPLIADAVPAISAGIFTSSGMIITSLVIMLFLIFEPRGLNYRWQILKARSRLYPFSY